MGSNINSSESRQNSNFIRGLGFGSVTGAKQETRHSKTEGAGAGARSESVFFDEAQSYADVSVLEVKNSLRFAAKDRRGNFRDPGPNLGDFFQLRVPEDDFGEIVFVEPETNIQV